MTTAPKVQRYDVGREVYDGEILLGIEDPSRESESGRYVLHSDYAALAARCERLEKAAKKVLVIVDHPYSGTTITECREIENILNSALALSALAPEPQQDERED